MQHLRSFFAQTALLLALGGFQASANAQHLPLGAPNVLSEPQSAVQLELPISQPVPAGTSVQLASPDAHARMGVAYPRWLADAGFSILQRANGRPALRIDAKRGNPTLDTEMVLEVVRPGNAHLQRHAMVLDRLSSFAGPAVTMPVVQPEITAPLMLNLAPVASAQSVPFHNSDSFATAPPYQPKSAKKRVSKPGNAKPQQAPRPASAANAAAAPLGNTPAPAGAQTAQNATPATPVAPLDTPQVAAPVIAAAPSVATLPTAISPAATPLSAQPIAANPTTPVAPSATALRAPMGKAWWEKEYVGLGLWMWGLITLVLALLLWFLSRRSGYKRSAPVLTNKTQFQNSAQSSSKNGTNTVFGITPQEANAVHQDWLNQQFKKPN